MVRYSIGEPLQSRFQQSIILFNVSFQALRLVDIRAKAMQVASDDIPSGMVTVTGLNDQEVKRLIESAEEFSKKEEHCMCTPRLAVANYLYLKCFVLAGHKAAVDYVMKFGVDKVIVYNLFIQ